MPTSSKNLHAVHWEVSSACQASCPVCLRRGIEGKMGSFEQRYTTLQEFANAIGHIRGIGSFTFCGNIGDPMTNPDIFKIARCAKFTQDLATVRINTNGGIGRVENYAELGKLGVIMVFGLDGVGDVNNLYRAGVDWAAVERNVRAFTDNKHPSSQAVVQFLVFDQNIGDVPNLVKWCREFNIDSINIRESFGGEDIAVFNNLDQQTHMLTKKNTEKYRALLNKTYSRESFDRLLFDWNRLRDGRPSVEVLPPLHTFEPMKFVKRRPNKGFPVGAPYAVEQHSEFLENKLVDVTCIGYDKSQDSTYVFITYDNYVMPCCFISGNFTYSRLDDGPYVHPNGMVTAHDAEMLNRIQEIGLEKFSLDHYTLEEILDSGVLDQLAYAHLESQNKLSICGAFCKK